MIKTNLLLCIISFGFTTIMDGTLSWDNSNTYCGLALFLCIGNYFKNFKFYTNFYIFRKTWTVSPKFLKKSTILSDLFFLALYFFSKYSCNNECVSESWGGVSKLLEFLFVKTRWTVFWRTISYSALWSTSTWTRAITAMIII